ncbi:MAG: tRNA uridine-5-carboxymethylaminomethyl(34) synthesis GTPase MnmE [Saprospiraceae bacterium]|nr:tRNA uridine-5-carboxymethylaminomethyl(34) synthesis GTPase MnmE [Saprospiraceae bacterium]
MIYTHHNLNDTIVALATPPGIGAIGVIRLSGKNAIYIANQIFFGKNLEKQPSHTAHFGTIREVDPKHEIDNIVDEVLATVFVAPRSYTKENVVEFSCHGSPYILQKVIELCLQNGARMAQAGEFTLRAFLNGQLDLSQAEAVADLIASNSEAAHSVAMRQMRGGFSDQIKLLRGDLINFASLIELELDFGEEDVEFANRAELKNLILKIQGLIKKLLDSFALGNVIKNGVTTVIAGRPNAGKSTLLNALLNEDRAIVSEIAGTTRDTIEEVLNIKGIEFRLVDTAGIREATDQIEVIGVAKTLERVKQATLLVYVFDVTTTKLAEVHADLAALQADKMSVLVVCNKMDRFPQFDPDWLLQPNDDKILDFYRGQDAPLSTIVPLLKKQVITASAKNHQNIDWLKENLLNTVVEGGLNLESPVVSNARHLDALRKSHESLTDVLRGLDSGVTTDFVAMDIRRSLNHLGEITGEVGVEDLLDNIFSKFCIGK